MTPARWTLLPISIAALIVPWGAPAPTASAVAPAATSSAYGAIQSFTIPTTARLIAIPGTATPAPADDTIFVADGLGALHTLPPLTSTGSPQTTLAVGTPVTAVVTTDDTLYVGAGWSAQDSYVAAYPLTASGAAAPDDSQPLLDRPSALALGGLGTLTGADDSLYAVTSYVNGIQQMPWDLSSSDFREFVPSGVSPNGIVVTGSSTSSTADDTVYVSGNASNTGALIALSPSLDDSVWRTPLGASFGTRSILAFDDSFILPSAFGNRVVSARNWDDSYRIPGGANTTTVSAAGILANAAYQGGSAPPGMLLTSVNLGNPATQLSFGYAIYTVAAAADGTFYAGGDSTTVSVVDLVTAGTLLPAAGAAGTSVTLTMTTQSGRTMDGSAVAAVWWGDDTIPFTKLVGQNAVRVTVPAGADDTIPALVQLTGGKVLDLGSFARTTPPRPDPPVAASAPRHVEAVPLVDAAQVTWDPPAVAGTFPITHYQVDGSPAGGCLVPVESSTTAGACQVGSLTGGAAYRFRVRALTGAGWGDWSAWTASMTPLRITLVIAGSRATVRGKPGITVSGSTTGLAEGDVVRPYFRKSGKPNFSPGRRTPHVDGAGHFTWSRRAKVPITVYFTSADGSVSSRRLRIS